VAGGDRALRRPLRRAYRSPGGGDCVCVLCLASGGDEALTPEPYAYERCERENQAVRGERQRTCRTSASFGVAVPPAWFWSSGPTVTLAGNIQFLFRSSPLDLDQALKHALRICIVSLSEVHQATCLN
jgi:hypothetical protein